MAGAAHHRGGLADFSAPGAVVPGMLHLAAFHHLDVAASALHPTDSAPKRRARSGRTARSTKRSHLRPARPEPDAPGCGRPADRALPGPRCRRRRGPLPPGPPSIAAIDRGHRPMGPGRIAAARGRAAEAAGKRRRSSAEAGQTPNFGSRVSRSRLEPGWRCHRPSGPADPSLPLVVRTARPPSRGCGMRAPLRSARACHAGPGFAPDRTP